MRLQLPRVQAAAYEETTSEAVTRDLRAGVGECLARYAPRVVIGRSFNEAWPAAARARCGIVRLAAADSAAHPAAEAEITARLERVYYDDFGLRLHLTGLRYRGPDDLERSTSVLAAAVAAGLAFGRRQRCYQLMGDCEARHLGAFEGLGCCRVGVSLRAPTAASPPERGAPDLRRIERRLRESEAGRESHRRSLTVALAGRDTAESLAALHDVPHERLEQLRAVLAQQAAAGQLTILLRDDAAAQAVATAKLLLEPQRAADGCCQALLTGVVVARDHRRRGLGRLVADLATRAAGLAGAASVSLDCFASDSGTPESFHEAVYTRIGYRREGAWVNLLDRGFDLPSPCRRVAAWLLRGPSSLLLSVS